MTVKTINLEEVQAKVQNVFPMPQILAKIMRVVNDPTASAATLEQIFKYEPSFTLKILTLANSAYYGSPGKITNIRAAITLLGFNLIKSIAIHASVNEFFNFGTTNSIFSGYELWKHSVGVGVCAKMISRRLKLGNAEDFFTLGILHDVGLIIEYQFYREPFLAVMARLQGRVASLLETEQEMLGTDHAALSQLICDKWNLPKTMGQALRYHHDPLEAPASVQAQACALYVANEIVKQKQYGFFYPTPAGLDARAQELLKISADDLEVLAEDFDQEIQEMTRMLE
ncbi:MAG: HDOD domain-containing protein [candidate division FCPU426 bacterium]